MKQSFTLKAVALGLAAVATLGASAVRPQVSLNAAAPLNSRAELSSVKQANIHSKAMNVGAQSYSTLASRKISVPNENQTQVQQPVSRAGINPYGPWEDAGTLTYTFNNLFDGEGPTKTYDYQKRVNSANADNFQIKVSDWGALTSEENGGQGALPGCELVLTVTPGVVNHKGQIVNGVTTTNLTTNASEGLPLGWKAAGPNNTALDMYFFDHATWANEIYKAGQGSADFAKSWAGSSYYEPETGKFTIQPIYGGNGDNLGLAYPYGDRNSSGEYTKYWYDYIQLSGKYYNYDFNIDTNAGYFYRTAGESTGHYKAHFALNDNAIGLVKIVKGNAQSTDAQAIFNEMVDAMDAPTADMAVFETPEGWFDLAVSDYADGEYTLIFGVGKAPEADGSINIEGGYYEVDLDGADFVLDGFAKYNDVVIPAFLSLFNMKDGDNVVPVTPDMFGLPATYTSTCQVEKSEKTAGLYRLRAPYAEYPGDDVFDYNQLMDYLYYNISDPTKATVEFCLTGQSLTVGSGTRYIGYGSTHNCLDDAQQTIFGTYSDSKFTFPSTTYTQEFEFKISETETKMVPKTMSGLLVMAVVPTQNGIGISDFTSPEHPENFLIETGVVDAIENVEASADVNAPVEYYNLQGQKVVNPAAGQLVIKKQGSQVTKMIAQ